MSDKNGHITSHLSQGQLLGYLGPQINTLNEMNKDILSFISNSKRFDIFHDKLKEAFNECSKKADNKEETIKKLAERVEVFLTIFSINLYFLYKMPKNFNYIF